MFRLCFFWRSSTLYGDLIILKGVSFKGDLQTGAS